MSERTFDRIIREVSMAVENFAREQGREPTRLKLTQNIYNTLKKFTAKQIPHWANSEKLPDEGIEGAFTKFPCIDTRNNRIAFYSIVGWGEEQISVE